MRLVLAMVLGVLVALPLRANAQEGEAATPKLVSVIHAEHRLPPHLILRASYYLYLDLGAQNGATSRPSEPNAANPKSAQGEGEVASPESKGEEAASSSAPSTTEVPDIDTLSQRAIENYEIQSAQGHTPRYAQSRGRGGTGGRSRGAKAGIAVGVIVGVGLVVFGIAAAVAVSNSFDDL